MGLIEVWGGNPVGWLLAHILETIYNVGWAILNPSAWLNWSEATSIMRVVFYGGSVEFFFFWFTLFLVVTAVGLTYRGFLWGTVVGLEGLANVLGRTFAWAGLLMVLQQIVIVFMQRIFAASEISIGFGSALTFDVSWWSEELKLYNAMIVCLCCTYTFVQRGHVRVDLVYSAVSFRTKRIIDMAGSLFFMMPMAVLTWMYGWYFMWRHLITPKPSASSTFDRLEMQARALRWNVETIGFSPNGFNAYFLFKVLLVLFAGLVFLHAMAFFWRSLLEYLEGEEAEDKLLDRDVLEPGEKELHGTGEPI